MIRLDISFPTTAAEIATLAREGEAFFVNADVHIGGANKRGFSTTFDLHSESVEYRQLLDFALRILSVETGFTLDAMER